MACKMMRQTLITHSTCASEYVAAADTINFLETLEPHLRVFDPQPVGTPELLIPLYVDNQSAIRIARGNVLTNASKHLKLRHIKVANVEKQLFFVGAKEQEADAFTKSLGEAIFGMMARLELNE